MRELKNLPIGIQTFRDIREGNYIYIDKTRYLYELVKLPKGTYFLSRPRRFGKSLLISALGEIFEGHKELFKGLWIYDSDYKWEKYPVLRFDFSMVKTETSEELKEKLKYLLIEIGNMYKINFTTAYYDTMLGELIKGVANGRKVVVLVDEYDKPIIDHVEDVETAVKMREVLKGFYTMLKGLDEYIRFVFLTGVSKFSKAGVFSGLNNLTDITMDRRYSSMLGITSE